MSVKGSIAEVEKQLKRVRGLRVKNRFNLLVERFKSLRNYLKYLGVLEEDEIQGIGNLTFDFGLVLENQAAYYSGMFFKLVVTSTTAYGDTLERDSIEPKLYGKEESK
jgi:hypothetical protein